jgi:hypothetical protein
MIRPHDMICVHRAQEAAEGGEAGQQGTYTRTGGSYETSSRRLAGGAGTVPSTASDNKTSSATETAAAGAARHTSGSSPMGRASCPARSARDAALEESTRKLPRWTATARLPATRKRTEAATAEGPPATLRPRDSAVHRTARRSQSTKSGCQPPKVLETAGTNSKGASAGAPPP